MIYLGSNRYRMMAGSVESSFVVDSKPYDYEVEWIGTNGNVIFNTFFVPNTYDIYINGKMYYAGYTTNTSWTAWFTAYTNEQASTYRIIRNNTSNTSVLMYNGRIAGGGGMSTTVALNTLYTFQFTPTNLKLNNYSVNFTKSGNANTSVLTIFSNQFKGRLYYFQLRKGDQLVLDLIPVVKDGVGCLYNKVTEEILFNRQSGTVLVGNKI